MAELNLFYKPTCPYCRKVLDFIDERGLSVPLSNIEDSADARQKLVTIGGKAQVPCLIMDGKALYESDDIIAWLKEHLEATA